MPARTAKKPAAREAPLASLDEYQRKRHFDRTPEPRGGRPHAVPEGALSFVIQKHAASRLHYDFRLELDGVLKSWAVPKGPSLDPGEKRLAVHVEDHPLEYGAFEGIIPKGEYGGGTVLLWDRGTWTPVGDPREGYRKGHLRFRLDGEKLRGGFNLVRTRTPDGEDRNWLLIKERDETATTGDEAHVVEREPRSVASRRTIDEIAAKPPRVWHSDERREAAAPAARARRSRPPRKLRGDAPLPETPAAMLATLVERPPAGETWVHEIKFDGYRALALLEDGAVRLVSRNNKDWTASFEPIARALAALPARRALVDGEVCVLEPDGTTSFQALQNALSERRDADLVYFAFDLLNLDGQDLRALPLVERKEQLQKLLGDVPAGPLRFSEHVLGNGPLFFAEACKHRLEGIVSKRADSAYSAGRGRDWLKARCSRGQEFVIGGWTEPAGSRVGFGALLVGYHEAGRFRYAGKVGTGFSERLLRDLHARLQKIASREPPFADPPRGYTARDVHWVRPELVCRVAFTEWTRDGQLRHPSFEGLLLDRGPETVVREQPLSASSSTSPSPIPDRRPDTAPARPAAPPPRPTPRAGPRDSEDFDGVRLTHPEKVLYPQQGITKRDLAEYYAAIAERALREIAGRPLSIVRCPEGHERECFFQKHSNKMTAKAVKQVLVEEGGTRKPYLMVDDVPGLISLVQMGGLEIHTWGAPGDDVEHPDRVVMDLDPGPDVPWERVLEGARAIRDMLAEYDLLSFVKTSGGKGLHVVIPFRGRRPDWDTTKAFAKAVAERLVREDPSRYVAVMTKARRHGRIFVDYLRNGRGATAIAPYSTRARSGAPVATPVAWDELTPDLRPDGFTIREVPARLAAQRRDPWGEIAGVRQTLTAPIRRAFGLG